MSIILGYITKFFSEKFIDLIRKNISWILLILACAVIFVTCARLEESKSQNGVYERNEASRKQETGIIAKVFEVNPAEMREKLQSERLKWAAEKLRKDTEINKLKQINSYLHYKGTRTDTIHDTKFKYIRIGNLDYVQIKNVGCGWKVDGGYFVGDSIYDLTVRTEANIVVFGVWERKRLWGRKKFPKWGKKQYKTVVEDSCSREVVINQQFTKLKK